MKNWKLLVVTALALGTSLCSSPARAEEETAAAPIRKAKVVRFYTPRAGMVVQDMYGASRVASLKTSLQPLFRGDVIVVKDAPVKVNGLLGAFLGTSGFGGKFYEIVQIVRRSPEGKKPINAWYFRNRTELNNGAIEKLGSLNAHIYIPADHVQLAR